MIVVFTPPARKELVEIAQYIELEDPQAAERLALDLRRRCLALVDNPQRGLVVATKRGAQIRRLVHRPYLIFCSLSADEVRIHRIIHGSRSPRALLRDIDLS